jgi:arylsulfatase A-like enzyme
VPSGENRIAGDSGTSAAAPRNVVLITLDTTRADALGVYGQSLDSSPHIDRLASEGVLFEQVVTSSPETLPSHASIFTGKQPYAHGVRSNAGHVLPEENDTLAEVLRSRGYRTHAEVAAPVVGRKVKLDQGFDLYRDLDSPGIAFKTIERRDDSGNTVRVRRPERPAEDVTRSALEFLRANRDGPFFLWLHYFDAHALYEAPPSFRQQIATPYLAEVRYVDDQVGRVAAEIMRLGLKQQTLVVLTSDHGEGLGDHDEDSHSCFVYDSVMRVPLVFWGPDELVAGRRIEALVRTVDIAPTILDLLDMPPLPEAQGTSLRPLLAGSVPGLQLTGYGESPELRNLFGASIIRFVREGNWKYIHKVEPELYDVRNDPAESDNLASSHPEIVDALRSRLRELIAEAPAAPAGAAITIDAETRSRLNALGYVGAAMHAVDDELATLEVGDPDPTTLTGDVRAFIDGWGHIREERPDLARREFERVWAAQPESAPVLLGLITALKMTHENGERLIPLLRRGIELDPVFTPYPLDLARLLQATGNTEEAESTLRRAVELHPCEDRPRIELANLLRAQKRHAEQLAVLEEGIEVCPGAIGFVNDYAYALATSPVDELRDGRQALALAKRAVARTGGERPSLLDTLAAAYAEVGDYENAVASSRKALLLLESRGASEPVVAAFRRNLASFEAGLPVREE